MSEFEGLKKVVSLLWTDRAKITGTKKVTKNHITNSVETTIVENEPCKVVLKGQSTSTQTIFGTDEADAKLLIRNGIDIPRLSILLIKTVIQLNISALAKDILAITHIKSWQW